MLIGLVSSRPAVFAETLGSFPDLRALAISVVHNEFSRYSDPENLDDAADVAVPMAEITLYSDDSTSMNKKTALPLPLLESACVILSIWIDRDHKDKDREAIESLVRMLMQPNEAADIDAPKTTSV